MKVIIVGCGKIGHTMASVLSAHKSIHVTVVDKNPNSLGDEALDVIFIAGNGASERVLHEAGAKTADLIVCTTGSDELNVLCCIMAESMGAKHSAARVRNPEYSLEYNHLWSSLGIDMVINPEQQTALEISRLLRYPAATHIDTFVGGRVELVSFKVAENPEFFAGKTVSRTFGRKMRILLAMVERGDNVLIPNGDLVFEADDTLRVLGRPSDVVSFFSAFTQRPKTQDVMIIGGGKITHYLTELLGRHAAKTNLRVIEKDLTRCEQLSETLPSVNRRCLIIHGDGADEDVLCAEGIGDMDAVICLTDRDEENAIISLYAKQSGVKKVITKVNHIRPNMIKNLGLDNIITPQNITADSIVRYVNGLMGAVGGSMRTMFRIFSGAGGDVQAVEFVVGKRTRHLDTPLSVLKLKKGVLIGCVIRNSEIIIPSGETRIQLGDSVIVIAQDKDVAELDDILANRVEV